MQPWLSADGRFLLCYNGARRLFLDKIRNLCRTELHRVDRASMGHGVEARVPFLDLAVVELAMRLPIELKMRDGQEKWIVRRAFADMLPDYIRTRPKNPLSYSAGLHDRARLYKPLYPRLHRAAGYDLMEPVRRDFDSVLMRCGNDLDRALADSAARQDYTVYERLRDLAGAARWNADPIIRRLAGRDATRDATRAAIGAAPVGTQAAAASALADGAQVASAEGA